MYLCQFFKMRAILTILTIITLSACNQDYNKVLKTEDIDAKYNAAIKYYNDAQAEDSIARAKAKLPQQKDTTTTDSKKKKKKVKTNERGYAKALPIFDALLVDMRLSGDRRLEEVYFFYAYCLSKTGDYASAAFHFKNYKDTYTRSPRREEAWYMYVFCKYAMTYPVELDQSSTKQAIQELQLFINYYPNSKKVDECNDIMDELRGRLRQKEYNQAMLYYNIGDYKAAVTSMRNLIKEYPGIEQREQLSYLIVKSHYQFAAKSIESKQEERYNETVEEYNKFKALFPKSTYLNELEDLHTKVKMALAEIEKAKKPEDKEEEGGAK